jgi:glycosyltransferase involved in cell wall biosynthesis
MPIRRKIAGYRNLLRHKIISFLAQRHFLRSRQAYFKWKTTLEESKIELLIGANLDLHGGVRNHIHSIHRYTTLDSRLAPDDTLLQKYGAQLFLENSGDFATIRLPKTTRVCHSHVSPWFIDMCHNNLKRVKWVHTHHLWYYEDTSKTGLLDWQAKLNNAGLFALRHCDKPLVVSRSQQRFLKQNFSIDAEYIPNGVDTNLCKNGVAQRFRRKYKICRDFLLWMGRNECVKNPCELLEAASQLPNISFIVAGNSCTHTELSITWGKNLPANVRAIGPLTRLSAQDALAACSALVVTSKREGLPTLLLEAMTHRKQIITSDTEGCLDAIDGKHGFVYELGNISHLCEQIQKAISQNQPNEKGYRFTQSEFSWENVSRKLDATYQMG